MEHNAIDLIKIEELRHIKCCNVCLQMFHD